MIGRRSQNSVPCLGRGSIRVQQRDSQPVDGKVRTNCLISFIRGNGAGQRLVVGRTRLNRVSLLADSRLPGLGYQHRLQTVRSARPVSTMTLHPLRAGLSRNQPSRTCSVTRQGAGGSEAAGTPAERKRSPQARGRQDAGAPEAMAEAEWAQICSPGPRWWCLEGDFVPLFHA